MWLMCVKVCACVCVWVRLLFPIFSPCGLSAACSMATGKQRPAQRYDPSVFGPLQMWQLLTCNCWGHQKFNLHHTHPSLWWETSKIDGSTDNAEKWHWKKCRKFNTSKFLWKIETFLKKRNHKWSWQVICSAVLQHKTHALYNQSIKRLCAELLYNFKTESLIDIRNEYTPLNPLYVYLCVLCLIYSSYSSMHYILLK